MKLLVRDLRWEAQDVLSVALADPAGGDLPAWTPGAHVDVRLSAGLERQYSLCSDPADRGQWRIAVLREPDGRGGSRFVHERLRPGAIVDVRGPVNTFELRPSARYLFLAGGIGITPILPMIRHAAAQGVPWRLTYLGRSRARMAFRDDPLLRTPRATLVNGGFDLASWADGVTGDTAVYCCGPARLLDAIGELARNWPPGTLRVERFVPVPVPATATNGAFRVICARSGHAVQVAANRSILECLEEAGTAVMSSCRAGVCGTCETRLLDGRPEHRDSILSQQERDAGETMMICVSRASTSELVLDV